MEQPLDKLRNIMRDLDSVLVAFSGGVDSSFLLHVAHQVLGRRAQAITFISPLFPQRERSRATAFCKEQGVVQIMLEVSPLDVSEIRTNPRDRCYHCKRLLLSRGLEKAREMGIPHLIDGSHLGDAADPRPGRRALAELGIPSPLAEAGLDKENIRRLSRHLGLPSWDLPPMACLASRIPHGTPLDRQTLARVEAAEEFLFSAGFRLVRVRDLRGSARIELAPEDIARLADESLRKRVLIHLQTLGYLLVSLDLEGYRAGKLNEQVAKLLL